jgi:hypothetical protein
MAKATSQYAASRNARFSNTSSNLIDLVQRLNETIENLPAQARRNWQSSLAKALKEFKRKHPGLKDIKDRSKFRMCKSLMGKLKDIVIDTTMQREPNLQWILKIITNFRAYQAQPIQVYETNGRYGSWDGQHTALAFYLISVEGLGLDFDEIEVPINIYDILSRGELRSNFINNNTTVGKNAGKKPLDIIDIFMQMIYGVEVDGVTEQEWVDAHAKWKCISDAGMFITADKFNDTEQVGAISRLNEIADEKTSVKVVEQFAIYGKYIVDTQQRPLNSKEIPIIVEFLNLCATQDVVISDADIRDLAEHLVDLFDANFDAKGPYWEQVHQANINAYNKMYSGDPARGIEATPKHLWPEPPKNLKNTPQGLAFFCHQLLKSWVPTKPKGFKFPKPVLSVYTPAPKDLM